MPNDVNVKRCATTLFLCILLASGCAKKTPPDNQAVDFTPVSSQCENWFPDVPGSIWIYGHPWADVSYPISVFVSTRADSLSPFFDLFGNETIVTLESLSDAVYNIDNATTNSKQVIVNIFFGGQWDRGASVDRSVFRSFFHESKRLSSFMTVAYVHVETTNSATMLSFPPLETNVLTELRHEIEDKRISIPFGGSTIVFVPRTTPQHLEFIDNMDDFVLSGTRFGNLGFLRCRDSSFFYSQGVGLVYVAIDPVEDHFYGLSSHFPGKATWAELIYCRFPCESPVEFINENWLRKGDDGRILINYTQKRGPKGRQRRWRDRF